MVPVPRRRKLGGIITFLAAAVPLWGQNPEPPASRPETTRPALDPRVDRILTGLETRTVRDLQARVSWKLRYVLDLDEDAVVKQGRLWYQQQKPVPKFLVHFEKKISSNRLHRLDERHLFDGRWYVELNSETKTLVRREIRRPDDPADPYKLGEGPFPVPFGQKKADILKEFEVSLVPPAADDPPDTDHLRLDPKPGSSIGRDYRSVDVWVARGGRLRGLPVKVHTAKKDGTGKVNSYLTITFDDIRLNEGFSGGVFELKAPPGYDVHEERLDAVPGPPGQGGMRATP